MNKESQLKKNVEYGIFSFRKDLRIQDNRGLIKLSEFCKKIIPVFIFDSFQVDLNSKTKNYLSSSAFFSNSPFFSKCSLIVLSSL